jgi:methylisocitrate lyase
MPATTRLRALLAKGPVLAASVFDPLSARLAELAGFDALHLTGFGAEAAMIGAPDMGIYTMMELAGLASRITHAVDLPVLSDADTGFGGVNNVARTIVEMERAGVAGVHIEDQTFPKKCPALDGRVVVSPQEAVGRIKAAVDARRDKDFVIVARTDADVISIDEAIARANLYLEAGADMAMPVCFNADGRHYNSLAPDEQMGLLRRLASGIEGPVMSLGMNPPKGYTAKDMADAGLAFIMFAASPLMAAMNAMSEVLREIRETGTDEAYFERFPGQFTDVLVLLKALKLDDYIERETRFAQA